ncbi:hypothetical protein SAMN05216499_1642 [Actinacidiphila paucisporea]|uniref:Uncharacterized protein n=1 Tax=Actinacidiphila paucisporea TaxID=310782 RepID=A0A1M7R1I9_9ACTN|nr:hypothetical protein SAMN05216499_1642 [Actinacidiphila paucisporea]
MSPLDHPPLVRPLDRAASRLAGAGVCPGLQGLPGGNRSRTRGVGSSCDLARRRGAPAGGRRVAVASGEAGVRRWPAVPVPGASWRGRWSGTEVHCCGTAKYMAAAGSGVRAGQHVGQSALLPVRTAWRALAGGRRRGSCARSAGPGSGRTGRAAAGFPRAHPRRYPRVHPTLSRAAGVFCLVRPLVRTSLRMPTTPLPSTLLGRTWGKGTVRRRRAAGCEGSSAGFGLRRAAGRAAGRRWLRRPGKRPGRAVGGSGDHGQPPRSDRRRGGVR